LLFIAQAGESVVANPASSFFYDLLPYVLIIAGAVAAAFNKRIRAWGEKRTEDKANTVAAQIAAQFEPVASNQIAILESLEAILNRLPPSSEEVAEALELVQKGIAAGIVAFDEGEPES
jgi:hypothetical protein